MNTLAQGLLSSIIGGQRNVPRQWGEEVPTNVSPQFLKLDSRVLPAQLPAGRASSPSPSLENSE